VRSYAVCPGFVLLPSFLRAVGLLVFSGGETLYLLKDLAEVKGAFKAQPVGDFIDL